MIELKPESVCAGLHVLRPSIMTAKHPEAVKSVLMLVRQPDTQGVRDVADTFLVIPQL